MRAKVILFTGVNQVTLEQIEIPEPGASEVLLEAESTLISPGTELRCCAGEQDGAMFPFIPGYSFVGKVIACGAGTPLKEGTHVYCGGTTKANVNRTWGRHVSHAGQLEKDVYPVADSVESVWKSPAVLLDCALWLVGFVRLIGFIRFVGLIGFVRFRRLSWSVRFGWFSWYGSIRLCWQTRVRQRGK